MKYSSEKVHSGDDEEVRALAKENAELISRINEFEAKVSSLLNLNAETKATVSDNEKK